MKIEIASYEAKLITVHTANKHFKMNKNEKVPVSKVEKILAPELKTGQLVSIADSNGVICRAKVLSVASDGNRKEISIRPTSGERNVTEFAFFPNNGWKMLFEGLGGERCFSQRAPFYGIESIE
ncbi:MAG: hypothetical protein WC648_03210 [Candidatus Paceibacterota bacterium]|jgi:hypothetical protein